MRDLINAAGAVIDHIDYDSFGQVLGETNPTQGDRFKFTGREYDAATALYYYRARFYDPATARFLSQDSDGFAAGDANLYRYVGNRVTTWIDPSGHDAIIERAVEMATQLQAVMAGAALRTVCDVFDAWAQDKIKNPWEALPTGFSQAVINDVANAALLTIMGPLGGMFLTVAAPAIVPAQIYMSLTGLVQAAWYARVTGDRRLVQVRLACAITDLALTFIQFRLSKRIGCKCLVRCFPAGTLVSTADGQRPIETVQAGEPVLFRDPTGHVEIIEVDFFERNGGLLLEGQGLCTIVTFTPLYLFTYTVAALPLTCAVLLR